MSVKFMYVFTYTLCMYVRTYIICVVCSTAVYLSMILFVQFPFHWVSFDRLP